MIVKAEQTMQVTTNEANGISPSPEVTFNILYAPKLATK